MRHHGEALRALTKNDTLIAAVETNPANATLDKRQRALVNYALKLTKHPENVTRQDVSELSLAGLSDAAIHDAAAIVAYFNFVNRLALGLGVELEDRYKT